MFSRDEGSQQGSDRGAVGGPWTRRCGGASDELVFLLGPHGWPRQEVSKLWAGECETWLGSGPGDRCGTSGGGRGSWVGIFPWDEGPAPFLGQQQSLQGRCRRSHRDLLAGGRPCLQMGALEGICLLFRVTGRWAGPGPLLRPPQSRQLQRKSSSSATAIDASEESSFPAVCLPVSRVWLVNWWAFRSWSR